eukprot:scaffold126_cov315-Pavlova_lutheri.AAC.26
MGVPNPNANVAPSHTRVGAVQPNQGREETRVPGSVLPTSEAPPPPLLQSLQQWSGMDERTFRHVGTWTRNESAFFPRPTYATKGKDQVHRSTCLRSKVAPSPSVPSA